MALSSSEIAAMNGAYQQQSMNNQAYAGMIGQGPIYGGSRQAEGYWGERVGGSVLTKAGSVGMPLAGLAASLAGIDPLSVGLRVGMGAYATGGIAGGLAAGAIAAAPVMAAGAVINYGAGQMLQGAHEQTQLNATLRNSFTFRNSMGGQGFTRADMSAIGSMTREMSEHFGPGGEIASFKELTSLAGKMGTMGFAQGVRDVKEFSTRFKEMVKTLKTMATELGTTLDGAMEFAAASKGSGIFGTKNVRGFTHDVSMAAKITNGALSQFTGAANIGSQISRSIGGLGRQGAAAGIRSMTQIRMAREAGVLSEEDVYNATGLTGAEGEQALMTQQLESSANFLRTTKGRFLMASMYSGDGKLDETVVQKYLAGDMSVGDTRREKEKHLRGGMRTRANFIRNEGRTRGAVLERFGGTINAIALKQWVEQKGIDFEDPDQRDRAMLFAQRSLGLGRDQADALVKQVESGNFLQGLQKEKEIQQSFTDSEVLRRKGRGIEGLKNRWEQTKETMGSGLRKFGQSVSERLDDFVDRALNDTMEHYTEIYSKNIETYITEVRRGGVLGRRAARHVFGIGAGGAKQFKHDLTGGASLALGKHASTGNMFYGSVGALGAGKTDFTDIMDFLQYEKFGQADVMKFSEAGVRFSSDVWKNKDVEGAQAHLNQLERQRVSAGMYNEHYADLGRSMKGGDWIARAYGMGVVHGGSDERMGSFEEMIRNRARGKGLDADDARRIQEQWNIAGPSDRAQLMANVEATNGVHEALLLQNNMNLPGDTGILGKRTGWTSEKEANEAWAGAMGFDKDVLGKDRERKGFAWRDLGLMAIPIAGPALTAWQAYKDIKEGGEKDERRQATGAYYRSDRYAQLALGVWRGGKKGRGALTEELQRLQHEPGANDAAHQVEIDATKRLGAAADLSEETASHGGTLSFDEIEAVLQRNGMDKPTEANMAALQVSKEDWELRSTGGHQTEANKKQAWLMLAHDQLKKEGGLSQMAVLEYQKDQVREFKKRTKEYAKKEGESLAAVGVMGPDGFNVDVSKLGLSQGDTTNAKMYLDVYGKVLAEEKVGGATEGTQSKRDTMENIMKGLSQAGKKKLAEAMGGQGTAGGMLEYAGVEAKFGTLSQKYGQVGAAARMLGVDMTGEDKKSWIGKNGLLTEAGAGLMLHKAGISGDVAKDFVGQMAGKKGDALANALKEVMDAQRKQELADKDKEKNEEKEYKSIMQKNSTKQVGLLDIIAKKSGGDTNPVMNPPNPVTVPEVEGHGVGTRVVQ